MGRKNGISKTKQISKEETANKYLMEVVEVLQNRMVDKRATRETKSNAKQLYN